MEEGWFQTKMNIYFFLVFCPHFHFDLRSSFGCCCCCFCWRFLQVSSDVHQISDIDLNVCYMDGCLHLHSRHFFFSLSKHYMKLQTNCFCLLYFIFVDIEEQINIEMRALTYSSIYLVHCIALHSIPFEYNWFNDVKYKLLPSLWLFKHAFIRQLIKTSMWNDDLCTLSKHIHQLCDVSVMHVFHKYYLYPNTVQFWVNILSNLLIKNKHDLFCWYKLKHSIEFDYIVH